eukprot:7445796-Pyramimonas_sp.AAC.2
MPGRLLSSSSAPKLWFNGHFTVSFLRTHDARLRSPRKLTGWVGENLSQLTSAADARAIVGDRRDGGCRRHRAYWLASSCEGGRCSSKVEP